MFPWKLLVPDLVTTLTTEPELRPYSASKVLVRTRNSSILSGEGCTVGRLTNWSLASPPLTLKLLERPRPPFTDTAPALSLPYTTLLVDPTVALTPGSHC